MLKITHKPCQVTVSQQQLLGQELLLLDTNNTIHVLNETAQTLWALCDGTRTITTIADSLRHTFVVSETQDVMRDTVSVVDELTQKGLIQLM